MTLPARVRLIRRYRFSASHLYRREEWSEGENRRHFGRCANLPGHGHNYRLYVTVEGTPAAETGFVVSLEKLDSVVASAVLDRLDHQHINAAIPEFGPGKAIPSSENLICWIEERLAAAFAESAIKLAALRLEEDEDLGAEWLAPDQS
jgi:6-pyruvoyltetrahydropterin/6-carboxytetrahydropterin synthase